jgi:hypothetical protein
LEKITRTFVCAALVEHNVPAGKHLLSDHIQKPVGLLPGLVPKHDALTTFSAQLAVTAIFGDECICKAAKWSKEGGVDMTAE